jgi:hypothetical protein
MPTRPADADTPEGQLAQELGGSATREEDDAPIIEAGFDGAFDEDSLEPELPPTPTQLGLEKAPDRPRGLLSSSPSMRHEKRMKRRATDAIHGSPLKSARFRDPSPDEIESESPDDAINIEDGLSAAAIEKRKTRRKLAAELQQLKKDVADLTKWTGEIESGTSNLEQDGRELSRFLAMLTEESSYINRPTARKAPTPISSLLSTLLPFSTNIPRPNQQASPLPTNPFALKASSQSKSYLTVFAPLTLTTQTSHTFNSNTLLETHTLKFTAPSPFPRALYNVSVVYETNPEHQTITSISVPTADSKKRQVPETLRRWIDTRLANPLLNLDVATLCWAINRYWEASLARAQLWAHIEKKYGRPGLNDKGHEKDHAPQDGVITLSELRRLVPHLERNTMVINSGSGSMKPRILLSNVLTIDDWTGEPQLRPELSVAVSHGEAGRKIDTEAKRLFHGLLSEHDVGAAQGLVGTMRADVILRATDGTLGVFLGS